MVSRAWAAFGVIIVTTTLVASARAQEAEKAQSNAEAVKAAIEPDAPPIIDPVYGPAKSFAWLGPPGPYFPDRAVRLQQGGVAVLKCKAGDEGRLQDCSVLAEGPTTFEFGQAALKMASTGYMRASSPAAGAGGEVRVVVTFPKPRGR